MPSVQFPAASSVMNPEMLIWPMTAQNKDYFPFLFAARDQVITLISLLNGYYTRKKCSYREGAEMLIGHF